MTPLSSSGERYQFFLIFIFFLNFLFFSKQSDGEVSLVIRCN